jgi:Bax protein
MSKGARVVSSKDGSEIRVIRPKSRQDQDFIYAALGALTLCVAALYMAVALPRVAPLIAPKLVDLRLQALGSWIPSDDVAAQAGPVVVASSGGLEKPAQVMQVGSTEKLTDLFAGMGYNLGRGDQVEVPRVFLASLPSDLKSLSSTDTRKELFTRTMLPLVLKVNESILLERGRLLALRARSESGRAPTAEEAAWLNDLAARYGLEKPDYDQLLTRVDVIPPSLALAQAAEESGWGTSRFMSEGNAAFGQYTFAEDAGLVPTHRDDGKRHLVRSYDHLLDAVQSYAHNLNIHDAYRQFRKQRAETRARGQELNGYELASSLYAYSERRADYIDAIQSLIRANNLEPLDRAKLRGGRLAGLFPSVQ